MGRVAVFTDASRVFDEEGEASTYWGWVAVDFDNPHTSFAVPKVNESSKSHRNSNVHAEVMAVYDAAMTYSHVDEVHIFTDSMYASTQVAKSRLLRDERKRKLRVFPELIEELAGMPNVHVHYVRAHSSYFFNELVDMMVGFVSSGELSLEDAEEWGRSTARSGVIELVISKSSASKPKYVRRTQSKTVEMLSSVL